MRGSWVRDGQAGISYDLVGDGGKVARVDEWARAESTSVGAGFTRHFKVTMERAGAVVMNLHREKRDPVGEAMEPPEEHLGGFIWHRWPIGDGLTRWVGAMLPVGAAHHGRFSPREDMLAVKLTLAAGESTEFRATNITTSGTDEEVRKALTTEVGQ